MPFLKSLLKASIFSLIVCVKLSTQTCIHYRGTMPFNNSLPFLATISFVTLPPPPPQNSPGSTSSPSPPFIATETILCKLNTTYAAHDLYQRLRNEYPSPDEKRRDEIGKGDKNTWGFRRWDMVCGAGLEGWVNVGLRSVGFVDDRIQIEIEKKEREQGRNTEKGKEKPRRREIGWVTEVKEDIFNEQWVFKKDIDCEIPTAKDIERERRLKEEEQKSKVQKEKEKARKEEEERNKGKTEVERKKESAQRLILDAVEE